MRVTRGEELAQLGQKYGDALLDEATKDEVAAVFAAIKREGASRASAAVACAKVLADMVNNAPAGLHREAYAAIHTVVDNFLKTETVN